MTWGLMALRESDLNGYCPKKESVFTIWKRARFEGAERETDLPVHAHCITSPSSLIFSLFFSIFFLIFFLFFLLCFSFYNVKMLCFSISLSGYGKGPFIVPAVTNILPFCPLTAFVWSGRTCRPSEVCATHSCQTEAGFISPSTVAPLSCHGINAFSLFPSRHAPNGSPSNLALFQNVNKDSFFGQ